MAKTAARSDPSKKEKKKKKGKGAKRLPSGPAAAAMKAAKPPPTLNPFESIWSRRKFDVVGKRRKGEERRIGLSRSLAVEKRKKTLLKEYEQSAKSSVFLDNRIGEKDDTLQEFDKAVLRLQRERQLKLKRTSKYNLSDDEEDDTTVDQPHSSDKDDFEDEVPLDDDEDADFKNGGGLASPKHLSLQSLQNSSESSLLDGEDQTHKSKKQVMMEIISKRKFYKITMATICQFISVSNARCSHEVDETKLRVYSPVVVLLSTLLHDGFYQLGSSILDDSPIEQVRLTVPPTDDNTLQVLTFRTWLIGIPICILGSLKLKRTSKYNLSDDEEDDTTVDQPHSSDKDDFEDEVPLDDDEDADFKNGGGLASPKHLSLQSLQNSSESSLLDGEDQITMATICQFISVSNARCSHEVDETKLRVYSPLVVLLSTLLHDGFYHLGM
ncbi:uncharacterized protein LOC135675550 isoform X3 [Musa acuminata AAA Group]|uniref:uncharacterized protein LOC135675550 isoform X3 n=1 Tax=Musa acuminata AAA Group TaxID=214697 RepID=UPI0031CE600E